jgi:hypothetical protein
MSHKPALLAFLLAIFVQLSFAQQPLSYYLPDIEYDERIPTPESFFGHQIGEWHLSHDKLVYYMKALAEASPRVTYTEYARSYEGRPLLYLTITSPDNQDRIDEIQAQHVALSNPEANRKPAKEQPVVLYQGFSIHGNEASGGNAAPMVAYYLAAGQSPEVLQTLKEAVVLLDPCFNPDGFHRFSTWVNMHKNLHLTANPQDREYDESWPGGRTNHYWFDLNRDWLLVQHPESRGRIEVFHQWKPNVLTDHHEMGSNATFFFMPGIPSRTNPITPPLNQELTGRIGNFHAEALDDIGSLYYTKESYDDFYYGKGSTYPDANGGIGILFEQASSRGHVQETENGLLTFPFTIRNQVRTALSTQKAGVALRQDLLQYQYDFYREGLEEARGAKVKGYVFGAPEDPVRTSAFLDLLLKHKVQVYQLEREVEADGVVYAPGQSYVVPAEQAQYRLVRGMFETMTSFTDSIFYDVSSWTLPLAFGMDYTELVDGQFSNRLLGQRVEAVPEAAFAAPEQSAYAYLLEWESYCAPKALYQIQAAGLRTKVATEPFVLNGKAYQRGTILVPVQNQERSAADIHEQVKKAGMGCAAITAVTTGLTPTGIDLGSRSFERLEARKVALVVGEGVYAYEAGAAWHLLDQRYGIPLTMLETDDLGRADLTDFNTIIMVNGSYGGISQSGNNNLREWVSDGGNLIAVKSAIDWADRQGLAKVSPIGDAREASGQRPYEKLSADRGSDRIGGAIMEIEADLSHPLFFGYSRSSIPVFQRGITAYRPTGNQYATPAVYAEPPLISGYARPEHERKLAGSAATIVSGAGRGRVICLPFDPNFRAFWYGTNRIFANALFFSDAISGSAVERASGKPNGR